ncbi:MAG: hypothetical protein C0593_11020 [Marinilabiliales bacterium]|nr:MAG: hypothetical protein C0593_11020 [Marinilabiliales bacterium]
MKRIFSIFLASVFIIVLQLNLSAEENHEADTVSNWKSAGNFRLTFNQIGYSNWAQGGENSFTGNSNFDYSLQYTDEKLSSITTLNTAYGIILTSEDGMRKNDDKLQMSSKLGYTISKKMKYTVLFDLKSQFSPGYKYPNDSVIVSNFFAPGYLTLSFGTDWNPMEYLSVLLSPASGRFTVVSDQDLANAGKFGVEPATYDTAGNIISPGQKFKGEFGMNFVVNFKKDVVKNVNVTSKLELHNNYFAPDPSNRWNFDVDMETKLNFTINKYLSSLFYIHLLYDDDVLVSLYDDEGVETGKGPRVQIKEHIGFGLSFKF